MLCHGTRCGRRARRFRRRSRASSRQSIRCQRRPAQGPLPEALVHRYYDAATSQFLSVDPAADLTGTPYAFTSGDPVNGSDPGGLCVSIFGVVCVGSGPVTSTVYFQFRPGNAANSIVNVGRGASFGLSDRVANAISPGASCTIQQNGLDRSLGSAAASVVGASALTGIARAAALRLPYASVEGLDALGATDAQGNISVNSSLEGQDLQQTLLHEAVHSAYTKIVGTAISQATYSTGFGQFAEEWAAETFATGRPLAAFRFALGY